MKRDNKKVIYWLFTGCVLIFIMVVVGGITRLTHSGLSIPDYKLISGTIPPINDQQWEEAFELYKQYPEYQKLNSNINALSNIIFLIIISFFFFYFYRILFSFQSKLMHRPL